VWGYVQQALGGFPSSRPACPDRSPLPAENPSVPFVPFPRVRWPFEVELASRPLVARRLALVRACTAVISVLENFLPPELAAATSAAIHPAASSTPAGATLDSSASSGSVSGAPGTNIPTAGAAPPVGCASPGSFAQKGSPIAQAGISVALGPDREGDFATAENDTDGVGSAGFAAREWSG